MAFWRKTGRAWRAIAETTDLTAKFEEYGLFGAASPLSIWLIKKAVDFMVVRKEGEDALDQKGALIHLNRGGGIVMTDEKSGARRTFEKESASRL